MILNLPLGNALMQMEILSVTKLKGKLMKKNVLITGGAGFIGSNLALKLVALGHSVSVLDNLSPQIHGGIQTNPLFTVRLKIKLGLSRERWSQQRIGWKP